MLTTVGLGAKCPQQDTFPFIFSLLPPFLLFHISPVWPIIAAVKRESRGFCNNFITHMVNGALYALVRKGIDFPH